jgi:hypothetical protein
MCTHVQSGDEIMRQLERMVFGDENTGKAKTGDKKKGKKQKKGEAATDDVV